MHLVNHCMPRTALGCSTRALPTAAPVALIRRPLAAKRKLAARASKQQDATGKQLARDACVAAAVLSVLCPAGLPAMAAAVNSTPDYGPWSFYNMTQYQVELFFDFYSDGTTCLSNFGGTGPGYFYTYPMDRGSCRVKSVVATAFTLDKSGNPKIVDQVGWEPTDPASQKFSQWAVLQVQNESPSIKVVHIID